MAGEHSSHEDWLWDCLHPMQPGACAFEAKGDWVAVHSAQPLCGPGGPWASHMTCWLMTQAAYDAPPPSRGRVDATWLRQAVQASSFAWQLWRLSQHIADLQKECAGAGFSQRKYRLDRSQSLGLCLVPAEGVQPWTFQQHYTYGLELVVTESVRKWLSAVDGRLTSSEFHGERTAGIEVAGSYAAAKEDLTRRLVEALLTKPDRASRRVSAQYRVLKQDLEHGIAEDTKRVLERLEQDAARLQAAVLAVERAEALAAGHARSSDPASRINHTWRAMWMQEHLSALSVLCNEKPALLEDEEEDVKVVTRLLEVYLRSNPQSVVENILRALLDNSRTLTTALVRAKDATNALKEAISRGDVRASGLQVSLSHAETARVEAPEHAGAPPWSLVSTRSRYPSRQARLNTVVRELLGSDSLPVGVVSCECALTALEIAANELRGQVRRMVGDVDPPPPLEQMRKRGSARAAAASQGPRKARRVANAPLDQLMSRAAAEGSAHSHSEGASVAVEAADPCELLEGSTRQSQGPQGSQAPGTGGGASEAARSEVRPGSTIASVTSVPSRAALREDRSACSRLSDYRLQPSKLTLLDRNLLEHLVSYLEQRGEGFFCSVHEAHRGVLIVEWDVVLQSLTGSQQRFLYEMHPSGIKGARNTIRRFAQEIRVAEAPGYVEWYCYKKNRNTPRVLRLQLGAREWLVEQLRALIQRLGSMDFVQVKAWVGHRATEVMDTLALAAQW